MKTEHSGNRRIDMGRERGSSLGTSKGCHLPRRRLRGRQAKPLDPIVREAMASISAGVSQNNVLAGPSKNSPAACFLILRKAGIRLEPDSIYEEALRICWRKKNADRLVDVVKAINSGRSLGANKASIRSGGLELWRERVEGK